MTFFNRKEEVINIELTQYGKYLLSRGKFKPVYYEFFDDDIIYDNSYTGDSETEKQKDIQNRIKESPRTHTQYTFVGAEESIKKQLAQVRNRYGSFGDNYIPYPIKHRVKTIPLGRSELGEQKKAAWDIRLLNGTFFDAKTFITGTYSNLSYPRLTVNDINFKVRIRQDNNDIDFVPTDDGESIGPSSTSDLNQLSTRFSDNSYLEVESDYLLIDLKEINVPLEQEQFELELYSIEEDEAGEEVLKQLHFRKKIDNVINNILVEPNQGLVDLVPNTNEMAESFFNIQVDREINSAVLCAKLSEEEKAVLTATNQLDIDCEESYTRLINPRIKSNIVDTGDKC